MNRYSPRNTLITGLIIAIYLLPLSVFATTGTLQESAFSSGFWHPILGFDHLLAMLAVGLLSTQLGSRAIWYVPATFVILMAAGGLAGLSSLPLPHIESIISLSVFALGLAIAIGQAIPVIFAMIFVGVFAIFHGYAHGAEIPELAEPKLFIVGFMCSTALLHLAGVGIGELCRLVKNAAHMRSLIGAAIAGIGVHMLLLSYAVI